MSERVNVLTLKWGTIYPADYVNRIYRGVERHLSRPFRFVCVTDDPSGLLPEVEPVAFPARPEWFPPDARRSAWPGIFVKLLVFEPGFAGLEGPTLFLDIDQIVVGGLDRFFDYRPGEFCIIRNWIERRKRIFRKVPFCGNSSCFRFDAGERSRYIYDTFRREVAVALDGRSYSTEQAYMTHAVGRDRVNFWPADFVVSFKRSCERPWPFNHFLAPRPPAPGAGILCFHGRPSPEEAIAGYRGRHLNTWTLPCPWLRKLWERPDGRAPAETRPKGRGLALLAGALAACAAVAADSALAPADDAVFADASAVPTAPAAYRRPADWKPTPPFPKTLPQIARERSEETMARARAQMEKVNAVNRAGKYAATGRGIDRHACPEWFVDAKLGMFVDWGPWSIAAYSPYVKGARLYPDWYEYKCRPEYAGTDSTAAYHRKNWGDDFKPDHFIGLFRGERFDAPKMMKVFRRCGAKYVVQYLKHHSGFSLWDDPFTLRNSVNGPAKRDFAREMADAARAEGLKFGAYNSQADEWDYPILQDDGSVRMKLWRGRIVDYTPEMEGKASGKIAVRDFVYDYIVPQMTAFVDRYDPDILWYDADWSTRASENGAFDITAYFYNRAEGRKEVCVNDRLGRLDPAEEAAFARKGVKTVGCRTVRGDFFTDEWGDTAENIDPNAWHPWESNSGISKAYGNHWMEDLDPSMVMTDREFICHFTSIVARGGNLLLLVNLDAHGAIRKVQEERLLSIGRWLERNGEAIYATRIVAPFSTPDVDYTRAKDGSAVYAVVKEPAAEVALACEIPANARVTALGETDALPVRRAEGKTIVTLPPRLAKSPLPFVLKVAAASGIHPSTGRNTEKVEP